MAKQPPKKPIEKKPFDLDAFLEAEGLNQETNDKELTWIPLSKPFHDALKIPGFPRGYVSLIRGFSNTGKSTAFYEAIVGCQKIGDLAVVIETEGNWNNTHAKQVGVKFKEIVDESTGEIKEVPDGFILMKVGDLLKRYQNYNHDDSKMTSKPTRGTAVIEDVALFINQMLDKQANGQICQSMCFLWDSIGTLNCFKSAISNSSNNMWNAGAMNCFGSIVNQRIPSSRNTEYEYTNTIICVQKIWLDNMNGTVIKHKGGEFMFSNSRIIVHVGGILTHGTKKITATALGQDFQYGIECKIRCEKNHVTGIERNGTIVSTSFGYVNPSELDEWKKEHRQFIHDSLNVPYDYDVEYKVIQGEFDEYDVSE